MKINMSTKLVNLYLLFPNNTIITINFNNLIIKGPFGVIKKEFFIKPHFFYINSINIKYFNRIYNRLTIRINKKNYSIYRSNYHNLITNIKKYIEFVSTGFLSVLQVWGIGYKIVKKNNNIYLFLGYSHPIKYTSNDQFYLKPFEGTYFFLTGHLKENLLLTSSNLKKLKKKDIYKGKGIRFLNETILLKAGKKE